MTEKLKFSAEWADCTTDKNQKKFDGFKRTTRPLSRARGRRGHQKGKKALTLKKNGETPSSETKKYMGEFTWR